MNTFVPVAAMPPKALVRSARAAALAPPGAAAEFRQADYLPALATRRKAIGSLQGTYVALSN
jgi:hypothetical protein